MIISLSGNQGSGKSVLAEKLAKTLGWPRYYMGGLRREAAANRGLTLAQYNKLGETDPTTDLEVDQYQKKLGETEDNFIIEGRTSWYFIPHSLKIFLKVDELEGARRILLAKRAGEDDKMSTLEEVLASTRKRQLSDQGRYLNYFGIDAYNPDNFDYLVDTTNLTPEEVFDQVYGIINKELAKEVGIDNSNSKL
jgi:predicted cytidylate kinase